MLGSVKKFILMILNDTLNWLNLKFALQMLLIRVFLKSNFKIFIYFIIFLILAWVTCFLLNRKKN